VYIQRYKAKQFRVAHFRQQSLTTLTQQALGQRPPVGEDFLDPLLEHASAGELVDQHIALLADAQRAVSRLVFHRRVIRPGHATWRR
jgi:hypothetical protein